MIKDAASTAGGGPSDPSVEILVPPRLDAAPGTPAELRVRFRTTADSACGALIRLVGIDPSWGPTVVHAPACPPGESATVPIMITVPKGTPAGQYPLMVAVQAADPQTGRPLGRPVQADVVAVVGAASGLVASLPVSEPKAVWGRRIRVNLTNRGTVPAPVTLEPTASSGARLRLRVKAVEIPPGATTTVRGRLTVSRPRAFGQPRRMPFAITVHSRQDPVRLDGFLRARPWIGRAGVKVTAFVAVMALWLGLGLVGLGKLAGRGDKQDITVGQLTASPSAGAPSPDAPGSGSGSGSGSGGTGGSSGQGGPGGSGGPTTSGERVTGTVSSAEPGDVTVTLEPTSLVDERIEGASFAGVTKVASVRPLGKVPAQLVAYTAPAVVSHKQSTSTSTNGSWSFAGVKAPGYYLVTFAKPGYQTQRYIVAPTLGADPQPLAVALTAGRGHLSGRIDGPAGALGGVSVTITDGTVTATTSTPTTGEVGSWSMAGLSTPGTYLVTASAPGYGAESRLVTLAAGGSVDGVDLTMRPGVASLVGKVSAPDETGAVDGIGGVTVSVTDGTTTRTATTVTTGPVGSYVLPQLPIPAVYTVTITGDGYAPRTQQVELTVANAQQTVDALLSPSAGTVTGTVTGPDGTGVVGAGLTLAGENGTYKTMSVSNPAGGFRMTGVTPGSYVLTVSKYASVTQYVAVTVDVGTPVDVPVTLAAAEGGGVPTTSHIRGAVVDARTGGVITCDASTAPAPCVVTVSTVDRRSDGDRRFEVTTDPDTPYLLPPAGAAADGLAPGLHTVTVSAPGYESSTVQVQVPLGAIVDAAPVALSPAAVITGTLTAAVGAVPRGTCIVAVPYGSVGSDGPDCTPHDVSLVCETTAGAYCAVADANGNFVIRRLDHGSYRLFILLPDQSGYAPPAPVDITLAVSEVRRYDTTLNRYGQLVVVVQAPDSNGALSTVGAGVPVTLTPGVTPSTPSSTFYTGAEGSVTIGGLAPGNYRVETTRAPASAVFDSVSIGFNQTISLTAALTSRVGAFRGQVVYAIDGVMRPVPGAGVSVSGITGYNGLDPRRETGPASGLLATNGQGCFAVVPDSNELPPGSPCGGAGVPSITLGLRVPSVDVRVDASAQGFGTTTLTGQPVTPDGLLTVVLPPPGRGVTGRVAIEPAPGSPVDLSRASIQVVRSAPGAGLVSVRVAADGALTWNDPTQSGPGVARPGTYLLRASLPGYDSGEVEVTIPYSAGGAADPFALPTLLLGAHGGLTVRAVTVDPADADRTVPVADAVFVLTGPTVAATTLTAPPGGTSVTFPDLSVAGGPYQVEVRARGYVFTMSAPTSITSGQVAGLDIALPRAGAITGTVSTSVAGQASPLAGITVTATRGAQTFTTVTDADGRYRVTGSTSVSGLVPGNWTVSVQRAGYNGGAPVVSSPLAVNNNDVAQDLVLPADKVGVTFVVQTDDATPKAITTATVTLTNDSLAPVPPINGSATGKYSFTNLDATQYSLQVVAANYSPLSQVVTLQVGVAQQTVYITLASRPNSVHGLVSGQRGSAAAQALAAATVTVLDASGATAGTATTSAQGEYQVQGLPDGTYTVRFTATDYVSADRSVEVRNGQIASVNTTLTAITHQLTVVVVSDSGATMTGAAVTLTANPASTGQSQGTQQAAPGAGGATTVFNQVLSGAYTVTTSGPVGHRDAAATVTIKPTDTDATVTVTVHEQLLRVSVSSVKATGSSSPTATVSLLDAGNVEVATGTVLADGTAVFARYLPLGTYQVRASAAGYTDASTSAGVVTVSGAADTLVPLTITELGSLKVSVSQDGDPVTGATVSISGPTTASPLVTSSAGSVTFTGLVPGSYTVTVTSSTGDGSGGPVTVRAGREASVPVTLPPTPPPTPTPTPTPTEEPTDEPTPPGR